MVSKKTDSLEVSSDQIHSTLIEIKERIAAVESIQSLANRQVVATWAKECLKTDNVKKIVAACEQPKTRDELCVELGFNSTQALHPHLKKAREYDLLQQETNKDGIMTFRWSPLFSRLPKKDLDDLLGRTTSIKAKQQKVKND